MRQVLYIVLIGRTYRFPSIGFEVSYPSEGNWTHGQMVRLKISETSSRQTNGLQPAAQDESWGTLVFEP